MNERKVYLVGAGPGRPDLITVRGLNILKQADVVVHDYLVNGSILEYTKEGVELICCGRMDDRQERINSLLIKKAKEGKRVARLKNGDPSIFSRCAQELDSLVKEGIEFEVVPGVTAASAASCLSGIPLTDRRFASVCVFVTGHEDPAKEKSFVDWDSIAKGGTVVLYMAVENLANIVKRVIKAGTDKNTAVAIIQDVSLPTQRVLTGTLKDIVVKARGRKIRPPAIIIIGKVAKLEQRFNWLKKNKRILFTGLSPERFFIKGTYFHLPLISIEPMGDYTGFDTCVKNIEKFDWIVFASRYGVEYFFKRLKAAGCDSRILNGIKIAAVGNSTKDRLLEFGILADLVPGKESSKGLIDEFRKVNLKGKKIFLPRSNLSDKNLKEKLEELGAKVTTGVAYKNVMPKALPDLDFNLFDEVMFTSPSTVRNFKERYGQLPKGVKVNCIGNVTLKEAKRCRLLD